MAYVRRLVSGHYHMKMCDGLLTMRKWYRRRNHDVHTRTHTRARFRRAASSCDSVHTYVRACVRARAERCSSHYTKTSSEQSLAVITKRGINIIKGVRATLIYGRNMRNNNVYGKNWRSVAVRRPFVHYLYTRVHTRFDL